MNKSLHSLIYILTIISVVLMSAFGTTTAYADEGAPPEVTETAPLQDPPAGEAPPPDSAGEELTVPEIIEQVPDGTDLVLINDTGAQEPLASQEAAEILVEGDPVWCPDGQAPTPGINGCTPSYGTFENLVTELTGNAAYSGNGVIWVESSYAGADNNPILFDGTSGNLAALSNLTLKGGWDGGTGSTNTSSASPSLLDVSLRITNWVGNIKLENLEFLNALDGTASLQVETDGNITLDNVEVSGNSSGSGTILDNCLNSGGCAASGNISVTESSFSSNDGSGLRTESSGDVTLKDVTASNNTDVGININTDDGNANNVKLTNVTVDGNGDDGIHIYDVDGDVTLINITATNNDDGVEVDTTYGSVYGSNITATGNQNDGVDIDNTNGSVILSSVTTSHNDGNGFEINYVDEYLKLIRVTAENNLEDGAYIQTNGNVIVKCSQFIDNEEFGLDIEYAPSVQLLSVKTSGNNDGDINYDPLDTTLVIKTIDCSSKNKALPSKPYTPKLYTKLFCVPGEIKAALYATYGNQVEFKNLCGYEAGIFDQGSGEHPKAIPGGEEYISSLYNKVLQEVPNALVDGEHGEAGLYAVVLDELPYILPEGYQYSAAFFTVVLEDGEVLEPLPEESGLTIKFRIPDSLDEDEELTILWWDGLEWQDLGGEISEDGLFFQVTTSEVGVFVLAIH